MKSALTRRSVDADTLARERRRLDEALRRLGHVEQAIAGHCYSRLLFGLDLTGSREPGLLQARRATAAMFEALDSIGAIALKLIYYRGASECCATDWHDDAGVLCQSMLRLTCETGETQIERILRYALAETEKIAGLVFIGDHCEESSPRLQSLAGALGDKGIPIYLFHECSDYDDRSLKATGLFKRLAKASGGVYVEFRPDAGLVLKEMLSTVAAFATAGLRGVELIAPAVTAPALELRQQLRLTSGDNSKSLKG